MRGNLYTPDAPVGGALVALAFCGALAPRLGRICLLGPTATQQWCLCRASAVWPGSSQLAAGRRILGQRWQWGMDNGSWSP